VLLSATTAPNGGPHAVDAVSSNIHAVVAINSRASAQPGSTEHACVQAVHCNGM
jgi:hypothetical protein